MNPSILNREFQHPADGWYMIEPYGEHPNARSGRVQIIDAAAGEAIANQFNAAADAGELSHGHEMLIDIEHFKFDPDKETRAYGWLSRLQNREDGLYGTIRWSATGRAAVDGGDYRFFSTEYDTKDLTVLNEGKPTRVRPNRLAGLTLTNTPNNKGGRPITNRNDFPGSNQPADENQNKRKYMKSVCTLLGLSPEADEASVHTAVSRLNNRGDITPDALATLRSEHKTLVEQNALLLTEQNQALLDACGVKEEKLRNRLVVGLRPLANRDERLAYLADFGYKPGEVKAEAATAGNQTQLRNRDTKPPENPTGKTTQAAQTDADKIMNRAREIQKETKNISLATAIRQAQREAGN